jgi:hypothetical protein
VKTRVWISVLPLFAVASVPRLAGGQQTAPPAQPPAAAVSELLTVASALQLAERLYRDQLVPAPSHLEELAEESYRAGRASILTVLGAQLEESVGTPLD